MGLSGRIGKVEKNCRSRTWLENQSFTCPKCNRTFANPISVEDLSTGETVSYSGCPYCLTEITEISECAYHFGYLSERAKGKEIPEECMTCLKTVECMLWKLKKSNTAVKEIKKWYCYCA
jgi:hypothetical protein